MLTVSELFIYPIKSLGGIKLTSANLTDRGFELDRRWMLVDHNMRFLTQREYPQLSLLQVEVVPGGLQIFHKKNPGSNIIISADQHTNTIKPTVIWDDNCNAALVSPIADEWFSEILSIKCHLVFMPDASKREVDKNYAFKNQLTTFTDGYPLTIICQASLDDLNQRLAEPVPMNRFRPNIVFTGGSPYEEDRLGDFMINGITFHSIKPCARCMIITIDQDESIVNKEPLKTLSTYRMQNNKVYFGQNLLYDSVGRISTGDIIKMNN